MRKSAFVSGVLKRLWLVVLSGLPLVALPAQSLDGNAAGARSAIIDLVAIPGGTFMMGSYDRNENEQPAHSVTISAFLMARTETTQLQYQSIIGRNPSSFSAGSLAMLHPVENVCWFDAILFCNLASQQEGLQPAYYADAEFSIVWMGQAVDVFWKRSANGYRLPTESEWEYAARAGVRNDIKYPVGGNPEDHAWYSANSGTQDDEGLDPDWLAERENWTHRVGLKAANGYGLYDLIGNVREWCWDWYGNYSGRVVTNPYGPGFGPSRVLRGGGYASDPEDITVTVRAQNQPGVRSPSYGFRVCRNGITSTAGATK